MVGTMLLDFSILCFSCIAIYNYIFGNRIPSVFYQCNYTVQCVIRKKSKSRKSSNVGPAMYRFFKMWRKLAVEIQIPPLFEKSVHGWSNVARFFFLLKAAPPPHFEKSVHGWYNVARFFNFIFSSPKNLLFSKMFNKIPGCKEKFRKKKIFLVCRIILSSV